MMRIECYWCKRKINWWARLFGYQFDIKGLPLCFRCWRRRPRPRPPSSKTTLPYMKREDGEPAVSFARRLYAAQTKAYSDWAKTDLRTPLEELPPEVQQAWLRQAENRK